MGLNRFDAFMPHGMCYMWRWDILLLHVGSDILIAIAYFSIPAALFVLIRNRPDIPRGIIKLFVAFILLCGITHLINVVVVWHPFYFIQGLAKLATAGISLITAIVLWPFIPKIIAMPSVKDLEVRNQKIDALNKRLELRLESLETLAGGVSHEFNNLLTIISGNAELLEKHVSDVSDRKKLSSIQDAAHRSADICSKMMAFSGSGHFVMEEINITEFLHSQDFPRSPDIKTQLSTPSVLPAIQGSPSQFKQMLNTLLSNSQEAIEEAGHQDGIIKVSARQESLSEEDLRKCEFEHHCKAGDYVILELEDNGIGVSDETREHMFEPYYTTKFTGRGLGLAALQGIVRGHNACLFVDSDGKTGCKISIAFPLITASATTYNIAKCPHPSLVLIVDDEESVLEVARAYLEELGINVLTASNSEQAISLANEHRNSIDVLILDYLMPDETGLQLLDKISRVIDVDTYLTSGFTRGEISDPDIHSLLTGFIPKPFSKADFIKLFDTADN